MRLIALLLVALLAACTTTTSSMRSDGPAPRSYTATFDQVWGATIESVANLGWTVQESDKSSGLLTARVSANLLTYGDAVTIRVVPDGNQVTVRVASTSEQAFDWGKGGRNIERLYAAIGESLSQ
jgi:uncharacterized protein (DUF1499 family)